MIRVQNRTDDSAMISDNIILKENVWLQIAGQEQTKNRGKYLNAEVTVNNVKGCNSHTTKRKKNKEKISNLNSDQTN